MPRVPVNILYPSLLLPRGLTLGVDATTKALGESIKQEEESLMWCMQFAKNLQLLLATEGA